MLVYLSVVAIFLYILHFTLKYNARAIRKIPGPSEHFLVGNALEILVSPVELFRVGRRYAKTFKDLHSWWAFSLKTVSIYNPEDIETVLSTMKHSEKSPVYRNLHPWLREGLLLSSGSKWQARRKILTPAFHFNILRQFWPILEENSQRLIETLGRTNGNLVDVMPVISEYTLSSICETAMGTRLHEDITNAGKSYKRALYKLGEMCVDRFSKVYLANDFIFKLSSTSRETNKHLNVVHSFTKRVIQERKDYVENNAAISEDNKEETIDDNYTSSKKHKLSMLDLLISSEKQGVIDRIGVQEEVDTFMFEGHDTTASALTHCLMLLANNKHIQDKIVAELHDIFGNSNRLATVEDVSSMRYLECCIKEALRLYPPVYFMGRKLSESVKLSNYTVPAGTVIHIYVYDLHRREDLFKNALVFDPDRFLPENCVGRHPYAYIPFSAGPRNCIGQRFAMLEMKSCLAAILRKFELQPVTGPDDLQFAADLILRNTKPVYVKFTNRIIN